MDSLFDWKGSSWRSYITWIVSYLLGVKRWQATSKRSASSTR